MLDYIVIAETFYNFLPAQRNFFFEGSIQQTLENINNFLPSRSKKKVEGSIQQTLESIKWHHPLDKASF